MLDLAGVARARQRASARRRRSSRRATRDELGFRPVDAFEAIVGGGVRGTRRGPAGSRPSSSATARLLEASGHRPRRRSRTRWTPRPAAGRTLVVVAIDGAAAGVIAIARPGARPSRPRAVRELRAAGHRRLAASPATAARPPRPSARQVGIPADRVVAEVLPGGQGGDRRAAPAPRPDRGDGRRRHQRRAGARPGRPRDRHRDRRGRRDRGGRHHARRRRPARRGRPPSGCRARR